MTPTRSFYLFFLCFIISSGFIYFNYYTPWVPAFVVAAYGLILWVAQYYYYQVLSDPIRNSPYFLGFLLTLATFLVIFLDGSESVQVVGSDTKYILKQIGSAITTTIVGLLFRQSLFTIDPIEDKKVATFQAIVNEIRENAVIYKETQSNFVNVLNKFVDTREKILKDERDLSVQYIKLIKKNYDNVSKLSKKYDEKLEATFNEIDNSSKKIEEKISNNFITIYSKSIEETLNQISVFNKAYIAEVKLSFDELIGSLRTIKDSHIHKGTNDFINTLNNSSKLYSEAIKNASKTFTNDIPNHSQELNQSLQLSINTLGDFNSKLDQYAVEMSKLPMNMQTASSAILEHSEQYEQILNTRLKNLAEEIKSIDGLIADFIDAISRKIENIA